VITVSHVADNAGVGTAWKPTLRYAANSSAPRSVAEPDLLWRRRWGAIAFWRRGRHDPRLVYFFSMGAPLFLSIAPLVPLPRPAQLDRALVLPLFCLMVIYWDTRWRLGSARIKPWLTAGLALGFIAVLLGHDTNLIGS